MVERCLSRRSESCLAVAYFSEGGSEGGSESLRKTDQIMQNEPNLKIGKMNASVDIEYSYGKICPFSHEKNKPKTCGERSRIHEANFQTK